MALKMLHVCIRVKNLDASLKFYRDTIGLVETRRKEFPDNNFTLVYLSDDEGKYELELTYNYNPEKDYIIGDGYSHIAVGVDNLEESHEIHSTKGYEITPLKGLPGQPPRFYFLTDPDGYKVEFIRN